MTQGIKTFADIAAALAVGSRWTVEEVVPTCAVLTCDGRCLWCVDCPTGCEPAVTVRTGTVERANGPTRWLAWDDGRADNEWIRVPTESSRWFPRGSGFWVQGSGAVDQPYGTTWTLVAPAPARV